MDQYQVEFSIFIVTQDVNEQHTNLRDGSDGDDDNDDSKLWQVFREGLRDSMGLASCATA